MNKAKKEQLLRTLNLALNHADHAREEWDWDKSLRSTMSNAIADRLSEEYTKAQVILFDVDDSVDKQLVMSALTRAMDMLNSQRPDRKTYHTHRGVAQFKASIGQAINSLLNL